MAKKFLSQIDFNKIAAKNFVVENGSSAPATPVEGQLYIDTDDDLLYVYNGATWVQCTATNIPSTINAATAKATPVDADIIGLVDTEDSNSLKKMTFTNLKAFLKTYFDGLYPAETVTTIGALINGATAKTTPAAGDMFGLMDDSDSHLLKKFGWSDLITLIPQKYSVTFGNASDTTYTITHNLGTKDIIATVRVVADDIIAEAQVTSTSTTQATVTLDAAPGVNALRITIIG